MSGAIWPGTDAFALAPRPGTPKDVQASFLLWIAAVALGGFETALAVLDASSRGSSRKPRLNLLAAAVGLIDDLPRAQAIDLLRRRAEAMDEWRASITAHLPPHTDLETWGPVGDVIGLWLHTAESRAAWTRRLLRRLEGGAYRMAGEDPEGTAAAPPDQAKKGNPWPSTLSS